MNTIIVDDSLMHIIEVERLLENENVEVSGKFQTCDDALKHISSNKVDLVILDLFFDGQNDGIVLAQELQNRSVPFIVCTNFPYSDLLNHLETVKPNAFLVKPLNEFQFAYEIQKLIGKDNNFELADEQHIVLKENKSYLRLPYNQISHIDVDGNYSKIHTDQKNYVVKKSLRNISEDLSDDYFIKLNRSTVVNIKQIREVNFLKKEAFLNNGMSFPIGRKYIKNLNTQINA